MKFLKWSLAAVVLLAALAYAGIVGTLYAGQRALIFRPDATRVDPAAVGLARAREVALNPSGAPLLIGWRVAEADARRPVILYLHGNAANLGRRARRFEALTRGGDGLLAVSWRGYGGSEGEPSEAGFHEDVAAALAFLRAEGVTPDRIILYGESLGAGMAVMTAARLAEAGTPVRALILDSPYESIAAIAAERYWWAPVHFLMRDPFRADRAAPKVRQPVFAVHCREDWLTPYDGARRLMGLLAGPTRLLTIDRRCHVPTLGGAGMEAMMAFLAEHLPPSR
jgi:pimeloyl-ACP methyl ester carboxylesterase